jgi:hypothetical protein
MIATIRVWRRQGGSTGVYLVAGGIVVILMLVAWTWDTSSQRSAAAAEASQAADGEEPGRAPEREPGAFPVPALDLPHYHGIGVTPERPGALVAPGSAGPATVADTAKEVTGA